MAKSCRINRSTVILVHRNSKTQVGTTEGQNTFYVVIGREECGSTETRVADSSPGKGRRRRVTTRLHLGIELVGVKITEIVIGVCIRIHVRYSFAIGRGVVAAGRGLRRRCRRDRFLVCSLVLHGRGDG